jgi:chemotaxis response regulator CheB
MPKEAIARGATQRIVPLARIPGEILSWYHDTHPALAV